MITHLGRPDGCPNCVANVEPPQYFHPAGGAVCCHYQCTDCGHRWFTSWAVG